mmetsp:Transcript_25102/g.43955  ORF Transcript_25102/g.43955 Transcript_25102/m.43955 type:complete len:174 (-) Transcript_25102:206-727(-)
MSRTTSRMASWFPGKSPRFTTLGRIDEEKSSPKSSSSASDISLGDSPNQYHIPDDSRQVGTSHASDASEIHEILKRNKVLEQQCEELESEILSLRNDGNVLKMKTSITMSTYQNKIDSMTREKKMLLEQCAELQEKIMELREENYNRQREILHVEGTLYRTDDDTTLTELNEI